MAEERHSDDDPVAQSRKLKAASEEFIRTARARVDSAKQHMERARNVLQAAVSQRRW